MAVVALADYLPRLGAPEAVFEDVAPPPVDRVAEAVAAARAEAEAAHEAAILALREELAAATEARLAAARDAWVAEQSERLAEGIGAAFRELAESLGDAMTRVLAPFLATVARRQAGDELVAALAAILDDERQPALRVTGPADLLARIESQLGDRARGVAFEARDAVDVTVVADRSIIATQIGAWIDRLWHQETATHG